MTKFNNQIAMRLIALILVLACVFTVTACGGTTNNGTTEAPSNEPTEAPTQTPTEEPTKEPTQTPSVEPTEEPTTEPTEEPTTEPTEEPSEQTSEETTEPPVEELEGDVLRFDENGNFKVAIISDLRLNKEIDADIIADMVELIEKVNPSLVLFGGDIHDGSVTNESELRAVLDAVNAPLEEREILWCHTFGVDSEGKGGSTTGFSRAEQYAVYATYEYCITPVSAEDVYGDSNYVLPIRYANSNKIGFNLWCLDTNGYLNDYEDGMEDGVLLDKLLAGKTNLDTIHFSQMLWYWNKSVEMQDANGGEKIPGMMYMQVPVYQLLYLRKNTEATESVGSMKNTPSASERESGIVWTCFERGDVKGIFCGYDAQNDYAGKYLDMIMAGCASIGEGSVRSTAGIRVVTISGNGSAIETKMEYLHERGADGIAYADHENPDAFKLVIDVASKELSNEGSSNISFENNDFDVPKTIVTDSDLNMPSVVFTPGSQLSSLTIPALDFNVLFEDGFAYEMLIRVDVNPSQYVGILDYEEAGGFGLNVYPSTEKGHAQLYAEVATGTGWNSLKCTIKLHQWYHVAFSYDGTNFTFYVNGEAVESGSTTEKFRFPNFNGYKDYICIGGCAQAKQDSGFRGFTGAIALCNIFFDPISAEQASAMAGKYDIPEYVAPEDGAGAKADPMNPDLLKLEITANGATNTAANGPALTPHGGTAANKIQNDTTIGKNVLVFDGSTAGENYTFVTNTFEQTLLDGFACEVYFKAEAITKNYVSVIDYCEAGGFGINLYKTADPNVLSIHAEIKIGSSYIYPEYNVNVGEWVHCVFVYNGDKAELYVNGELVDSEAASSDMMLPDFASSPKIMCIGSGASKGQISGDRFIGSLAICNLFSAPVTADDVALMYSTNTAK